MKRLQSSELDYQEAFATSALREKVQGEGILAEQNAAILKVRTFIETEQK